MQNTGVQFKNTVLTCVQSAPRNSYTQAQYRHSRFTAAAPATFRPCTHGMHTAAFCALFGNRYKCKVYRFKPFCPSQFRMWDCLRIASAQTPQISGNRVGGYFSPERSSQNPKRPKLSNSRHPSKSQNNFKSLSNSLFTPYNHSTSYATSPQHNTN